MQSLLNGVVEKLHGGSAPVGTSDTCPYMRFVLVTSGALIAGGIYFKFCEDNSKRRRLADTSTAAHVIMEVHGAGPTTGVVTAALTVAINNHADEIVTGINAIETVEAANAPPLLSSKAIEDVAVLSSGAESLTPTAAMVAGAAVSMAAAVQGAMGSMGMGN